MKTRLLPATLFLAVASALPCPRTPSKPRQPRRPPKLRLKRCPQSILTLARPKPSATRA